MMKKFQKILALLTLTFVILSGCSKDNDNDTPDPVALTNTQLLTAKTWQVHESFQNVSGTRIHYLRGGENTTGANMGELRIKFNADGTGTHKDANGTDFAMTWAFTSSDESKIHIVVGGTYVFDWYFVDIEADALLASTNVATNGLTTSKWIPVP